MSCLVEIEERESAFENRLTTFRIKNNGHIDLSEFFEDAFAFFEPMVESLTDVHYMIKVSVCFHGVFEKKVIENNTESSVTQPMYLHTNAEIVDFDTNLQTFYREQVVDYIKIG